MHATIRKHVNHFHKDCYRVPDIAITTDLVMDGEFYAMAADVASREFAKQQHRVSYGHRLMSLRPILMF